QCMTTSLLRGKTPSQRLSCRDYCATLRALLGASYRIIYCAAHECAQRPKPSGISARTSSHVNNRQPAMGLHIERESHMKTALAALAVALTCFIGTAQAQDAKPTTQQEKMKWCNQQAKAKDLKGDE